MGWCAHKFLFGNRRFVGRDSALRPRRLIAQGVTLIIQPTPKRSSNIPKRGDQNVLLSGMVTLPPFANAAKARSASPSVATESESEKPSKLGFSVEQPS